MSPLPFLACASFVALTALAAQAATTPAVVDDFSNAEHTSGGAPRFLVNDKDLGGKSAGSLDCAEGRLTVKGELAPARGSFGFVSLPLLLSADMQPHDVSAYTGVRLRLRIAAGTVTVQVCSSEIQNFDFHSSAPLTRSGEVREVRLAFKDLRRAWSEQTPLNLATITSVNLVASGMAPGAFAYEVDEVSFY